MNNMTIYPMSQMSHKIFFAEWDISRKQMRKMGSKTRRIYFDQTVIQMKRGPLHACHEKSKGAGEKNNLLANVLADR
jgi:recombinational DNA repair ATPase RecF